MKRVSDLYFAGYELCSDNSEESSNKHGNTIVIKSLHNMDYTLYLSPCWDRQQIEDSNNECKKVTNTDASSDKSTNSPNSISNEIVSMANFDVTEIDICYVYDECELLENERNNDEKECKDHKEEELTESWVHGSDLERLQSSYQQKNTKGGNKDDIDVENMPEKLTLLGYTYCNGSSGKKCNVTNDNVTLVYLLSVTPNNQAEIWKCNSLAFLQNHYRLVASMCKETAQVTTYVKLQELVHKDKTSARSRACRLPVMWRGAESSTHNAHRSFWFSPVLELSALTSVYQVSLEKVYYIGKWQKYIRFVGVSCAVPWVCDVTDLEISTIQNEENDTMESIVFALPLPNCYSLQTLLEEYEICDAQQSIMFPCKTEKHIRDVNHHETNTSIKNIAEQYLEEEHENMHSEWEHKQDQLSLEKQRTTLKARQACNECEWISHFAKCVQIRRNMAIVKGAYGVILSCEITSPMLSRLKLSHKDRLVCLPKTGKECTVVGTCGEHLVVLYDDSDTVHLIREFPLRTETDVALYFVRENEIGQAKEEEEENTDKDESTSCTDTLVESENVNCGNSTNIETHEGKGKVSHVTHFTDFLIAHAVNQLQAQNSSIDNTIDNVCSGKVFEYYYNSINTLDKIIDALHAYQSNNPSKEAS